MGDFLDRLDWDIGGYIGVNHTSIGFDEVLLEAEREAPPNTYYTSVSRPDSGGFAGGLTSNLYLRLTGEDTVQAGVMANVGLDAAHSDEWRTYGSPTAGAFVNLPYFRLFATAGPTLRMDRWATPGPAVKVGGELVFPEVSVGLLWTHLENSGPSERIYADHLTETVLGTTCSEDGEICFDDYIFDESRGSFRQGRDIRNIVALTIRIPI